MKKNKELKKTISKQVIASILFGISLLMLFVVLIPGESLWYFAHNLVLGCFGFCSILWPSFLIYISLMMAFGRIGGSSKIKIFLTCMVIILVCVELYIFSVNNAPAPQEFLKSLCTAYEKGTKNLNSGAVGFLIGVPFVWLIGITGFRIINSIVLFTLIMLLTGVTLSGLIKGLYKPFEFFKNRAKEYKPKKGDNHKNEKESNINISELNFNREKTKIDIPIDSELNSREYYADEIFEKSAKEPQNNAEKQQKRESEKKLFNKSGTEKSKNKNINADELEEQNKEKNKNGEGNLEGEYNYPPLRFLNKSEKVNENAKNHELQINGKLLVDTLKSFNVETRIINFSRGPAVTRYELQPASGVKISKITSLADDIALNLAAPGVRIEAPIPGKAAVGVEIPNKVVSVVNMSELISSPEFKGAKSKLTVVLGRDISGNVVIADLGKMPHILIAGSTGSGKSVCINSFIVSLLYKASPDEVKLIMIDPKVVELGVYNGIPHLLIPVVTDPKKAKGALSWAVDEMLKRYKTFAENNVRDMHSYNSYVERNPEVKDKDGNDLVKMYSIVIIIDELSDLMMVAPNEVEDYICRLAQMARAAGMHLVIATQRPSVDVITGIIKANIPSRIALAVSSQIDSRTILDMSGAEKLLGRGDMLFSPIGASKPRRVQGCYVTDEEIENVTNYIKIKENIEYDNNIINEINKNSQIDKKESKEAQEDAEEDPLLNNAIECVVAAGQASVSLLQRRLDIGYPRAGRLIDKLEKMGIIGPHEGSKPRQVLVNRQQLLEMNTRETE